MNRADEMAKWLPNRLKNLLKDNGPSLFLAGGAARDAWRFTAEEPAGKWPPKDFDLFMRHDAAVEDIREMIDEHYFTIATTERCITYGESGEEADAPKVQLITHSRGSIAETLDRFDFSICQIALWWEGRWRTTHSVAFERAIALNQVDWTGGGMFPAASLRRLVDLAARGFVVPRKTVADVAEALIREHGGDPGEQVRDEIVGSADSR
jgi:hypothetical protein